MYIYRPKTNIFYSGVYSKPLFYKYVNFVSFLCSTFLFVSWTFRPTNSTLLCLCICVMYIIFIYIYVYKNIQIHSNKNHISLASWRFSSLASSVMKKKFYSFYLCIVVYICKTHIYICKIVNVYILECLCLLGRVMCLPKTPTKK